MCYTMNNSLLVVTTNINTPQYIKPQYNSIKKHIINISKLKYIVICDAPPKMNCMLDNNRNATIAIKKECKDIGENCLFIQMDQIHHTSNNGSIRHAENLNWFFEKIDRLIPEYKTYKYMLILDSDAFIIKNIEISDIIGNMSCATPIIDIPKRNIFYVVVIFLLLDISKLSNFREIKFDPIMGITDTGGKTYEYFKDKRSQINCIHHFKDLADFYSNLKKSNKVQNIPDIWYNGSILHLRIGTYTKLYNLPEKKFNIHINDYFDRLIRNNIDIDLTLCSKKIRNIFHNRKLIS